MKDFELYLIRHNRPKPWIWTVYIKPGFGLYFYYGVTNEKDGIVRIGTIDNPVFPIVYPLTLNEGITITKDIDNYVID